MSSATIVPYLFYSGRCREALDYYQSRLGAQVDAVMHYDESPEPIPEGMLPPGFEKKIMHASFRIHGIPLMASDGRDESGPFQRFRLALSLPTEADAHAAFAALADGGEVVMPLGETFWSPCYGMVNDRFGLGWMVMVHAPAA